MSRTMLERRCCLDWFLAVNLTVFNGVDRYISRVDVTQKASHNSIGSFIIDPDDKYPSHVQPNFFLVHQGSKFALLYHCQQIRGHKITGVWVLSRDRNPDPYNVRLIVNLLETKGIFTPLVTLEQKRCPRLPDELND